MRIQQLVRSVAALALAVGVGLVVVSAASADSGKIKFRGEAAVLGLAPGATMSTFEYKNDGSIKTVTITTTGEQVFAGPLDAQCKPSTSAACDALDGSILFDLHNSVEVLRQVEVVPNPFFPGLDALAGNLSGNLEGELTVTDVVEFDVFLSGDIQMKIHGTATLGCFGLFGAEPIATCEAGFGVLLPVVFDVADHGKFQLGSGFVGTTLISGGEGGVRVSVAGNLFSGATGVVVINDATLTVAE